MTMKFFLITSDHFSDRLWFRDDEDFRVAMNYVAIVSFTLGINVLAFILMSNHVHFVVECTHEEAKVFADRFKMLYGKYYARKYCSAEYLRRTGIDIRDVRLEDESLKRAIAYVNMNSVAANICAYPNMYPWGTGDTFFNSNNTSSALLGDMSYRAQNRIIKSKVKLPSHFSLSNSGYILPSSYVPVKFVESVFNSASSYRYFLNNSSKARAHLETRASPSFRDQNIVAASVDLCRSLFRVDGVEDLTTSQTAELLRQLKYRFNSDINQLARVIGLSYAKVAELIDLY